MTTDKPTAGRVKPCAGRRPPRLPARVGCFGQLDRAAGRHACLGEDLAHSGGEAGTVGDQQHPLPRTDSSGSRRHRPRRRRGTRGFAGLHGARFDAGQGCIADPDVDRLVPVVDGGSHVGGSGPGRERPPRLAALQRPLADVRQLAVRAGAQVDRRLATGGRGGPGRLQELLAGGDEFVRPGAHPIRIGDQYQGVRPARRRPAVQDRRPAPPTTPPCRRRRALGRSSRTSPTGCRGYCWSGRRSVPPAPSPRR